MYSIDLNCDCGESFGNYKIGMDSEVADFVTSANIACGFHASDPLVMMKTVRMCKEKGVAVGAHPGFPDLVGFGRRKMEVKADELKAMIIYQVGALKAFAEAEGLKLQHVKPHGAMYNMAARDINMAIPICEGIAEVDKELIILGLSGSCFAEAAERTGLMFVSEVFADRAYEDDGSLRARSLPGAVITDEAEAIKRVIKMIKEHSVTAYSGKEVHVEPGSVCLHGDNEKALLFAKKIREALTSEGIEVKAMR
ncbi:MAG: 5-oxoprolinase subunit PxpA [Catonella sp.]|nr:5-oxoprolinase subunit PxpA [Catonella sp.]MDY6356977.1 5-oxoprolinase subunit PxpA [Catonella sp.]